MGRDGKIPAFLQTVVTAMMWILPNSIAKKLFDETDMKTSMLASNMAGSRAHAWSFDGKKTDWIAISTTSTHGPSVALASLHDKVKVSVTCRTGVFKDSKRFCELIEKYM